jgi:hypothetical protein
MRAAASGRAIVAGLAILAGCVASCALTGCGQRGSLYLPTVPPMPAKPIERTQPPSPDTAETGSNSGSNSGSNTGADTGSVPDTSGTPLSLAPETDLATPPASADSAASAAPGSSAPLPASSATPVQ